MSTVPGPAHLPLAVDANGELHDTSTIERSPGSLVPPLRCPDCGARLDAVRAYPRRDGPAVVQVAAHYRLTPGSTHAPSCPARTLAAPPSASVARAPSSHRSAPLVYSLVVPGGGQRSSGAWRSRSYRAPRRPAVNSAAAVADILNRHGRDVDNIRLDYRGRPISWRDFLFDVAEAPRLEQQLCREASLRYPSAVVGRIVDDVTWGRSYGAVLRALHSPWTTTMSDSRVLLRSTLQELLAVPTAADVVVALGWWRLVDKPGDTGHGRDIVLWINRRWQMSAIQT